MTWTRITDEWALVEAGFHATFGVDLTECSKSFRWFAVRVAWLLQSDNPLSRIFQPDPKGV